MPKGVMWRNEDLYGTLGESAYPLVGASLPDTSDGAGAIAANTVETMGPRVHLPASPLMHGTGAFSSFQALFLGGTVVTLEGRHFDPHEMWQTVEREGVTQMAIVGDAFAKPMVRALEEAEAKGKPYDLTSLGLIISSGVIWSQETKHALMQRANCFCLDSLGSSEGVGFANSMSTPGSEQATAKFTIGARAKVLKEDGSEVTPGSDEIGLLALGGFLPAGYYKDESKSAATFRELGGKRWSIPGDFARVEEDGTIVLLGRGSVVINSGGEKIFPEEVEEAVKLHPAVADCLVVGVPDDRFGEAVTAVVALRPGNDADGDDLTGALESLARYKRPRSFVIVPEVLRGPNGKADYRWAKEQAQKAAADN
jgi:fatty-acyl-CoA synthase